MNITYRCPRCNHRMELDTNEDAIHDDIECDVCGAAIDSERVDLAMMDAAREAQIAAAEAAADREREGEYFNNR